MVQRVVARQAELGIDIVTDGEVVPQNSMVAVNCPGGQGGLLYALPEERPPRG